MGGPGRIGLKKYVEFDNFYPCIIEYNEMIFHSSEQLYQALKFVSKDYQKEIAEKGKDPYTAWAMGQNRTYKLIDNFEEKKAELMYIANYEKYIQNPELKKVLLSTEGNISFADSSNFWNQMNAKILHTLRSTLKHPCGKKTEFKPIKKKNNKNGTE